MKKIYMNPEVVVIDVKLTDILTESPESEKDQELWQPGGKDQDWGDLSKYVNVN